MSPIRRTDKFEEETPPEGVYAYYRSDFCYVMVLWEEFSLYPDFRSWSLREYTNSVIENNEFKGVTPQYADLFLHFSCNLDTNRVYIYTYKGLDSFWLIQYTCHPDDAKFLEDSIALWASGMEIK